MNLLDLLFPKKCIVCRSFGDFLCPKCFAKISFETEPICAVCSRGAIAGLTHPGCKTRHTIEGVFSSVTYNHVMKKALYAYKYAPYVKKCEEILSELFYEGLIQQEAVHQVLAKIPVLVPIPLHADKLRSRGYNQADSLSQIMGRKLGLESQALLTRNIKTASQFKLKREERTENVKGAFAVSSSESLPENLVLIDDLLTSGATLNEAAKTLKKAGVKSVWGMTLAHGS